MVWVVHRPLGQERRESGSASHDGSAGTGPPVNTERRNSMIAVTCARSAADVLQRAYPRNLYDAVRSTPSSSERVATVCRGSWLCTPARPSCSAART